MLSMPDLSYTKNFEVEIAKISTELDALFPEKLIKKMPRLVDAMRYSALAPGKRLRPVLTLCAGQLFALSIKEMLPAALAVELVHAYSLIHDDLPAMDNSDLRRGQPTNHKKFDEATAILAGDALLTKAFEILSINNLGYTPDQQIKLVHGLATAAGTLGLVGGQVLDLRNEIHLFSAIDEAALIDISRRKTGALFNYCCEAAAILGFAPPKENQRLASFARHFGLAFQMVDDLLDVIGDPHQTGKPAGIDSENDKYNFVTLWGVEGCKLRACAETEQALAALEPFGRRASRLNDLTKLLLHRIH